MTLRGLNEKGKIVTIQGNFFAFIKDLLGQWNSVQPINHLIHSEWNNKCFYAPSKNWDQRMYRSENGTLVSSPESQKREDGKKGLGTIEVFNLLSIGQQMGI